MGQILQHDAIEEKRTVHTIPRSSVGETDALADDQGLVSPNELSMRDAHADRDDLKTYQNYTYHNIRSMGMLHFCDPVVLLVCLHLLVRQSLSCWKATGFLNLNW
jgi:hypothetical protein